MKRLVIVAFLFLVGAHGAVIAAASNIKGETAHPVKHYKYTFE
jgi:hypothetical protein